MLKYQCNKCEIQKIFKFGGFPSIKRTEPTLSNKDNKLWSRAKDTLK